MPTHVLQYNNEAEIDQAASICRQTFETRRSHSLKFRRHQLEQLWRLLDENVDSICEALYRDLRKHKNEAILAEIVLAKEQINDALLHLDDWVKDERTKPALVNNIGTVCLKRKEPKGAILLIGPWNYPIYLIVTPLVGAIAAGCTAVIKPSEVAPHSAKLLTELIHRYLDNTAYMVINGGAHETTRLLEHKWDHIFYTGNSTVAKIIMKAASKHLTTLTLELGGKSPVIIDENANLRVAAKRVAFGKAFNAGQTCIAPDYVLVTAKVEVEFLAAIKQAFEELYGEDPQTSTSYGRIINDRHFKRLCDLLEENKSGEIIAGGPSDEKDLYIAPTVVANVDREDRLMDDEIFGPILPVIRVVDLDDAIEFINSRDEPLALYIFSTNKKFVKKVLDSTRSGGVLINDTMMHVSEESLPFGGLGNSGMGSYHGKNSFDTFTHVRSVMNRTLHPVSELVVQLRYAPYNNRNLWLLRSVMESIPHFKKHFILRHLKMIIVILIFGLGYRRILS